MNHKNRVLSRVGARELTLQETQLVVGAIQVHTELCTALRTHGTFDGDGCDSGDR